MAILNTRPEEVSVQDTDITHLSKSGTGSFKVRFLNVYNYIRTKLLASPNIWSAKQTFTLAPRLNSLPIGNKFLKTDINKDLTEGDVLLPDLFLTGLNVAGSTAISIIPTDSVLSAFEHTQSQINSLGVYKEDVFAGGLVSDYLNGLKLFVPLNKIAVGLGNVDNTTDLLKPISTATQTALNLKENSISVGSVSQYWRGDKMFQTLDKSAVGLSNVPNLDATNPANTVQTLNYRYVTDAEKAIWNASNPTNRVLRANNEGNVLIVNPAGLASQVSDLWTRSQALGMPDIFFATLNGAIAVAVAGDIIVIKAGNVMANQNTPINFGVTFRYNIYLESGSALQFSNFNATSGNFIQGVNIFGEGDLLLSSVAPTTGGVFSIGDVGNGSTILTPSFISVRNIWLQQAGRFTFSGNIYCKQLAFRGTGGITGTGNITLASCNLVADVIDSAGYYDANNFIYTLNANHNFLRGFSGACTIVANRINSNNFIYTPPLAGSPKPIVTANTDTLRIWAKVLICKELADIRAIQAGVTIVNIEFNIDKLKSTPTTGNAISITTLNGITFNFMFENTILQNTNVAGSVVNSVYGGSSMNTINMYMYRLYSNVILSPTGFAGNFNRNTLVNDFTSDSNVKAIL